MVWHAGTVVEPDGGAEFCDYILTVGYVALMTYANFRDDVVLVLLCCSLTPQKFLRSIYFVSSLLTDSPSVATSA